jgi:hypothetical protein
MPYSATAFFPASNPPLRVASKRIACRIVRHARETSAQQSFDEQLAVPRSSLQTHPVTSVPNFSAVFHILRKRQAGVICPWSLNVFICMCYLSATCLGHNAWAMPGPCLDHAWTMDPIMIRLGRLQGAPLNVWGFLSGQCSLRRIDAALLHVGLLPWLAAPPRDVDGAPSKDHGMILGPCPWPLKSEGQSGETRYSNEIWKASHA